MKLVTFTDGNGTRIGIAVDGGIIDLKKADPDLPRDMIGLVSLWPAVRGAVERAATRKADFAQSAVKLEAPVPRPGKIMAIGLNYADHIAESGQKTPGEQVWSAKVPTSSSPAPQAASVPLKPPQFLKAGDVPRIEIDKIGAIEATVAPEQ
jgi:2-keto-4-pentenoate hydratase/2-oxohepta-3-ene-1,7-dioic acid hydratase in catechol pathway